MNGLHLIADLHDCRCPPGLLLDGPGLEAYCADACQRHGLTVVGRLFHAFRDVQGQPAGVTGTVIVQVTYDASGTVVDASVYKSSRNRDLDRAAVTGVRKWKINPGKKNGQNVGGTALVTVDFTL